MLNTAEYNFSHNEFYPTAKSEFTLQLTVHPVGPTTQRVQVLADKAHEWRLLINAQGQIVSKTPRIHPNSLQWGLAVWPTLREGCRLRGGF